MSNISEEWATYHSPVKTPIERLVLIALAQRTGDDGCDAYKSAKTLANAALCNPDVAARTVRELRDRGILKLGDQKVAAHIPAYKRPVVYDIQIPYSWYSPQQMGHLNASRTSDKGRAPLDPADRPDLAPAPERPERSDKGKKAPQRRPKVLGPRDPEWEGGIESPPLTNRDISTGGTDSPGVDDQGGGDSQSGEGGTLSVSGGDSQSPNSFRELPSCNSSTQQAFPPAVGVLQTVGSSALAAVPAGKLEDPPPKPRQPQRDLGTAPGGRTLGAIYRALPEELRRKISEYDSGRVLDVARAELALRSPHELTGRIARRWEQWRCRPEGVTDPVGLAITLLRRRDCPDVRCEDGHQLDLGQPCIACVAVAADRATARQVGASTTAGQVRPAETGPSVTIQPPPTLGPPSASEVFAGHAGDGAASRAEAEQATESHAAEVRRLVLAARSKRRGIPNAAIPASKETQRA